MLGFLPFTPFTISASTVVVVVGLCGLLGSHRVLRWPLLLVAGAHIAVALCAVAALVATLAAWDALVARFRLGRAESKLFQRLDAATSRADFLEAAKQCDESAAVTAWRAVAEHPRYNAGIVMSALSRLRAARVGGSIEELHDALAHCVRKSFAGIDDEELYSRCHAGTKRLIESYVDEVVAALGALQTRLSDDGEAPALDKARALLWRSRRVFGRTCLALSGGGGLANFSWGVARALLDEGLLPSLICGTSAGAVVAAALCCHTERELDSLLRPEALAAQLTSFEEERRVVLRRALLTGHMYDAARWAPKIRTLCNHAKHPHMTFAEVFSLTGKELCITVTARRRHEPPLVLSRLSSPDVTVASAVLATVAMPFLLPPQRLLCKTPSGALQPWAAASESDGGAEVESGPDAGGEWRDGSIVHDTPRELLAQHFGVSYTLTSQCNPHVVPLALALRPTAGRPAVSRLQRGRSDWRGGFALSSLLLLLLSEARKWLTVIRELELCPLILDTDWSSLLLQDFSGEATILPPMELADYTRALSDPTAADMQRYLSIGQRECWRKMSMLATRLRIARALQELQAAVLERGGEAKAGDERESSMF